jgi:hypothetical protein
MNITTEDKNKLKSITESYGEVYDKINFLEVEMENIINKKNQVSDELKYLRESEISLINKIESETGEKLTHDFLKKIINS